jgi:rhamnogalacturonyl hydrolase YesR
MRFPARPSIMAFILSLLLLPLTVLSHPKSHSPPLSQQMLSSIMARSQGIISSGHSTSTLESGVLALALSTSISQYPSQSHILMPYLNDVLAAIVPDLTNATADAKMPLDRFSVASALIHKAESGSLTEVEEQALSALTKSFTLQERSPSGELWYYVYPHWSYLDGIHSIIPFMASQPRVNYTDIVLQVVLLTQHCVHRSGLYVHGYDESRTAVWADASTGGSPFVWGRSLGWFMGGLVEGWEILCMDKDTTNNDKDHGPNDPRTLADTCAVLQNTFVSIISPLLDLADEDTGAWWQLTTFPNREGNFLESSSTMLFAWSMLKAARIGIFSTPPSPCPNSKPYSLLEERALKASLKAYEYTTGTSPEGFLIRYSNGTQGYTNTLGFDKTVAVNSLNSSATYEYYTSRPFVIDSLLGESAFVLAGLEVERLHAMKGRHEW